MMAERIYDANIIKDIVTEPNMWKTVSEDGMTQQNFIPEPFKDCWLKMTHEGKIIGLFLLHPLNSITLDIHPFILPKYRGKIGSLAGVEHLKWIYEEAPQYLKMVVNIPVIYRHVKLYANMLGYTEEGVRIKSIRKNGKVLDQWLLGITRDEVERRYYERRVG